jgi:hypothetical protein
MAVAIAIAIAVAVVKAEAVVVAIAIPVALAIAVAVVPIIFLFKGLILYDLGTKNCRKTKKSLKIMILQNDVLTSQEEVIKDKCSKTFFGLNLDPW